MEIEYNVSTMIELKKKSFLLMLTIDWWKDSQDGVQVLSEIHIFMWNRC